MTHLLDASIALSERYALHAHARGLNLVVLLGASMECCIAAVQGIF